MKASSRTEEFTYDAEGHPLSVTTPGWRSTYYTYDNDGNLIMEKGSTAGIISVE